MSGVVGKVYLIQRTAQPIGDEELIEVFRQRANIEFVSNSLITEIKRHERVRSITLENTLTKEKSQLELDGVFIEAGYVAKTDFLKGIVALNARKEIVTDKEGRTSHKDIFAAGDVTDIPYKQAVVSAGQGCVAALSAINHIQALKGRPAIRLDWKVMSTRAKQDQKT